MKPIFSPGVMPAAMNPLASATTWRWNSATLMSLQPPSSVGRANSGASGVAVSRSSSRSVMLASGSASTTAGVIVSFTGQLLRGTGCSWPPAYARAHRVADVDSSAVHAIGIDIGGTKIAGALVDDDGVILRSARRPTPAGDPDASVQTVVALIRELADDRQVVAAGVAAAGFVDASQSVVYYAPNINWRSEPLRDRLEA